MAAPARSPAGWDVSRGLENLPVGLWSQRGEQEPGPLQYTPEHVMGPGADIDPTEIAFPGCLCRTTSCLPSDCSCLPRGLNYDHSCLKDMGSENSYGRPIYECNVMCRCSEECKNRVVQKGLQFHLEVFKTDKKGWGLRTLESIPKGRFVCEYAGEILGFSEACRRMKLQTTDDSNYILAVREHLHSGQVIETFVDPTWIGNVGRFLNHSCEPNLLMVPVRIDSLVPKLALFATQDILPGEELAYDYSGRFHNRVESHGDQDALYKDKANKPCYCGTKSCAIFLPYDSSLYCPLENKSTN